MVWNSRGPVSRLCRGDMFLPSLNTFVIKISKSSSILKTSVNCLKHLSFQLILETCAHILFAWLKESSWFFESESSPSVTSPFSDFVIRTSLHILDEVLLRSCRALNLIPCSSKETVVLCSQAVSMVFPNITALLCKSEVTAYQYFQVYFPRK